MFDQDELSLDMVHLAQDAANRHDRTFYLIAKPALPGFQPRLQLTETPSVNYVERFDPQ